MRQEPIKKMGLTDMKATIQADAMRRAWGIFRRTYCAATEGNGPSLGELRPLIRTPDGGGACSSRVFLALDTAKHRRVQAA
jgi:hypothetical protein